MKKKIYESVMFNKRFPKTLVHDFIKEDTPKKLGDSDSESSEKDAKTKKVVNFDLVKFFTDMGAPECINKLQKQDLLDSELFFRLEMATLEGFLELKPEGKKMRVTKKIQEYKDKYDKDGKVEYIDLGLLHDLPDSAPVLKFQKSTTLSGSSFDTNAIIKKTTRLHDKI